MSNKSENLSLKVDKEVYAALKDLKEAGLNVGFFPYIKDIFNSSNNFDVFIAFDFSGKKKRIHIHSNSKSINVLDFSAEIAHNLSNKIGENVLLKQEDGKNVLINFSHNKKSNFNADRLIKFIEKKSLNYLFEVFMNKNPVNFSVKLRKDMKHKSTSANHKTNL